jgi:hypothetical protein
MFYYFLNILFFSRLEDENDNFHKKGDTEKLTILEIRKFVKLVAIFNVAI